MYIEKRKLTSQDIKRIGFTANIIIIVIFIILLFAFWNIQILKNQQYTKLAVGNVRKQILIKAPRGMILDRNHQRLSENKLIYNLFLIPEYSENINRAIDNAVRLTGMKKKDVVETIEKYKDFSKSYAIPLQKDISLSKVIYIESRSDEFPGFEVNTEPVRSYPYKEVASHVLGYISEMTPNELTKKINEGYHMGDEIGKSGVEKKYESMLRGVNGSRSVEKDNLGKIREILGEEHPSIGNTVVLTIDIELQKYVEEIFQEYNGTIGIVDLKTGGILALVSKPNFDPEFFSGVIQKEKWDALVNDPAKPLQNKFLQGLYLPGSTFKIVMSLAALQENIIEPSTVSLCTGAIDMIDRKFHCWNRGGHGNMNLYDALKNSCNIYFYRLGKRMDIDVIAQYAKLLGLGELTGVDLANEKKGMFPTRDWKMKTFHKKWYTGDTVSLAIGGGMMQVTPAQILTMISTVALRGRVPQLHLVKHIEKDRKIVEEFIPQFKEIPIARENFEIVIEGLYRVVNDNGTGRSGQIAGLDICGKTGTQLILSLENPNYEKLIKQKRFMPHAWFVSFAPRYNPEYAMVVFVENGGEAGAVAVPIAKKIYQKIYRRL
ncbi:MAG: penicillin-binding protein 2 [Acidobacteria bacterium]|jgi:penicillin-binding protein 2|nr:penicillin-binding protein 2 [Acidobacteriota bacterium]